MGEVKEGRVLAKLTIIGVQDGEVTIAVEMDWANGPERRYQVCAGDTITLHSSGADEWWRDPRAWPATIRGVRSEEALRWPIRGEGEEEGKE